MTGADPGFSFRGAEQIMCVHAHSRARRQNSLTAGVQGPPKGLRSSRGFDALSCYLSPIFFCILIQNGI